MKSLYAAFAALLICGPTLAAQPASAQPAPLQLWRMDCGTIDVDLGTFSDAGYYDGQRKELAASCYLIKNGDRLLLWDTGLDGSLAGQPRNADGNQLSQRLTDQLARIGVKPADVDMIGISHYHFDHIGQAADFPQATLMIGKKDMEVIRGSERFKGRFAPWLTGGSKVEEVTGDKDVFGDGRVTMLAMPGHTPGHSALLVKLASGPVLLSGDQYHFQEQVANRGVPIFNVDRADTLASHDRFDRLAKNHGARVIIQHDARDIAKLPAFPQPAQ